MSKFITNYFARFRETLERTESEISGDIAHGSQLLIDAFRRGNKLLIMGNGGSAADAEHFAGELVGRFQRNRKGLPAIALTGNSAIVTAVANDFGFEGVFRRQVEALAAPGDVVIGISTSGHSSNVYQGLAAAREIGCQTVALLGCRGGKIAELCDLNMIVPADQTPHIQEMHIAIIHMLCELVEEALFSSEAGHP